MREPWHQLKSAVGIWTVYGTVAVYAMAYMAQVPLLPYLLHELGTGGSTTYGRLATVFSSAQMLGGLLAGPLVDRWGGRALMITSLIASIMSYACTASATSLAGLYLSRAPTIMQHAILAARTMVAATAPPEHRARLIGYVGVAYGVGFAVGPALGGVLSQFGLRTTAWVATAASIISVVAVVMLVPADHKPASASVVPPSVGGGDKSDVQKAVVDAPSTASEGKDEQPVSQQLQKQPSLKRSSGLLEPLKVLRFPAVRQLMCIKLATGLAGALLQSVFTLMLQTQYGLSSKHNGMVLSYVGSLTMLSQALLVEPMRSLGEGRAVHASCVLLCASYLSLALTRGSVAGLMLALVPSAVGGSVMSTINTAQLTQAAPAHAVGSVLALDMSLFSAVRLFTPAVGTALLDRGGVALVGCSAAAMIAVLLVAIQLGMLKCDGGLPKGKAAEDSSRKDK